MTIILVRNIRRDARRGCQKGISALVRRVIIAMGAVRGKRLNPIERGDDGCLIRSA